MALIIREYDSSQIKAEYPIPLKDGEYPIGRSDRSYTTIGGTLPQHVRNMISNTHATISVREGKVFVRDGNGKPSQYGIYRGAHKITSEEEVTENGVITLFQLKPYRIEFRYDSNSEIKPSQDTYSQHQVVETILGQFEQVQLKLGLLESNQEAMIRSVSDLAAEVAMQKGENQQQASQIKTVRLIVRVIAIAVVGVSIVAIANPSNRDKWESLLFTLLAGGGLVTLGVSPIGKLEEKK